jgi:hypothetical protein
MGLTLVILVARGDALSGAVRKVEGETPVIDS